jgi:hypothetical protein
MTLPPKLAGGKLLECGHAQVLPAYRLRISAAGHEQHPVWCVECDDWSRIPPNAATLDEAEQEAKWESRFQFPAQE